MTRKIILNKYLEYIALYQQRSRCTMCDELCVNYELLILSRWISYYKRFRIKVKSWISHFAFANFPKLDSLKYIYFRKNDNSFDPRTASIFIPRWHDPHGSQRIVCENRNVKAFDFFENIWYDHFHGTQDIGRIFIFSIWIDVPVSLY